MRMVYFAGNLPLSDVSSIKAVVRAASLVTPIVIKHIVQRGSVFRHVGQQFVYGCGGHSDLTKSGLTKSTHRNTLPV